MVKVLNRAAEPSTWAGMAAIFQAVGFFFPQYVVLANAATVVAGCVAGAVPERGGSAN
jgi:hypothetical protein